MPDRNTFLFVMPLHDEYLEYCVLTRAIKEEAERLGYRVISLEGEDAVPEKIWDAIETHDPYFVYSSGHGVETLHTVEQLLDCWWVPTSIPGHEHSDSNVDMLRGRMVYLLSCLCGAELIPAIASVADAAIGYDDYWCWVIDTDYSPEEDPWARSFFECSNALAISLLRGDDARTACRKAYDAYTEMAERWARWLEEHPDAPAEQRARALLSVRLLLHNRDHLVLSGNEGASTRRAVYAAIPWQLVLAGVAVIGLYYLLKK